MGPPGVAAPSGLRPWLQGAHPEFSHALRGAQALDLLPASQEGHGLSLGVGQPRPKELGLLGVNSCHDDLMDVLGIPPLPDSAVDFSLR